MKIANWYENCKLILTFWWMVPTWTFAIFIWETQRDWKLVLEKRIFQSDAAWMTKTHREQSLAIPSTIHIPILIPVTRQSDSYFKQWFLRSHGCGMQFERLNSLYHCIVAWLPHLHHLGFQPTLPNLGKHRKWCKCASICPSISIESTQTTFYMYDMDVECSLNSCTALTIA